MTRNTMPMRYRKNTRTSNSSSFGWCFQPWCDCFPTDLHSTRHTTMRRRRNEHCTQRVTVSTSSNHAPRAIPPIPPFSCTPSARPGPFVRDYRPRRCRRRRCCRRRWKFLVRARRCGVQSGRCSNRHHRRHDHVVARYRRYRNGSLAVKTFTRAREAVERHALVPGGSVHNDRKKKTITFMATNANRDSVSTRRLGRACSSTGITIVHACRTAPCIAVPTHPLPQRPPLLCAVACCNRQVGPAPNYSREARHALHYPQL